MKYIAIGFLVFVLNGLAGITQELVLKSGDLVVNNDTIYLTGTKSTELLEVRLSVTNNTESAVSLKLKKTEIFIVEGTETSFCWGECYTPAVFISPMIITIQPRGSDLNSFIGDYRPFGLEGTSIVRYTFFDPANTTFQQSVTVFYQIGGSGTNPTGFSGQAVRVYPNPADQLIRISLSGEGSDSKTATLVNVQGKKLISENITAGRQDIIWPVSGLPSGFYFLRILDEKGSRSTYKICIRH